MFVSSVNCEHRLTSLEHVCSITKTNLISVSLVVLFIIFQWIHIFVAVSSWSFINLPHQKWLDTVNAIIRFAFIHINIALLLINAFAWENVNNTFIYTVNEQRYAFGFFPSRESRQFGMNFGENKNNITQTKFLWITFEIKINRPTE